MRFAPLLLLMLTACATTSGPDALMRDYDGNVPGASLLVIRDGQPIVRRAYGLADVENDIRATPATNYRLASVTKQFTATAILRLAEEGKLSLDDSVRRWLPTLPVSSALTIRHLLTHTSGLIDYEDVMPPDTTEQIKDIGVLRLLESQTETYFAPGTNYRYSNSGYALLALIVERASDTTFATYLKQRVFDPIGMQATVAHEENFSTISNRAYGHSLIDGKWTRTDQSTTSAVLGDGGIYSSIDDLVKWDAALYDPFYAPAFVAATPTDDPNVAYGFGWRISEHRGERMLWHSGETRGFRNVLIRFPARRLTVVLLTNRNEPPPRELALKIADLFWVPRRSSGSSGSSGDGVRSPKERHGVRSPEEHRGVRSAEERHGVRSPEERHRVRSPEERHGVRSPEECHGVRSPEERHGVRSPEELRGTPRNPRNGS